MKKDNPVFNIIDFDSWPRKSYFNYYYNRIKCTYSVATNIDITSLLNLSKEKLIKLYPAMIYVITTAINQIDELRISYNDKAQLGVWNFMSPSYTVFHDDDKTFSNIWTPYDPSFSVFNRDFLEDIERYGNKKDFLAKENDPGNTYPISCIPWIDFTGFNLNIYDNAHYLCPIFTIGKYTKDKDKIIIPVAAQLHHATCDGYHAGIFFDLIKNLTSSPEDWIDR